MRTPARRPKRSQRRRYLPNSIDSDAGRARCHSCFDRAKRWQLQSQPSRKEKKVSPPELRVLRENRDGASVYLQADLRQGGQLLYSITRSGSSIAMPRRKGLKKNAARLTFFFANAILMA